MTEIYYMPYESQETLETYSSQPKSSIEPEPEPKPTKKPVKYERDWSSYFTARQKEKLFALDILSDAIKIMNVKTYGKGYGRPPINLSDKIFLCIQKVLRNSTYDSNQEHITFSKLKKWVDYEPSAHTVCDFMNDPQITPYLENLIILLSTPMIEYEKNFSIDATGLSTNDRSRWVHVRLNHKKHKDYKKIHCIVGNRTKIITSADVTIATKSDCPMLKPLLEKMSKYFEIKEFCGDGAYNSRENATLIADRGGVPYFKIKANLTGRAKGSLAWSKMINFFKKNEEYYMQRYHKRSVVEAVYSSFKRKVSSYLRSKNEVSKINEAFCIAICHNLFILVNAVFCTDLDVKFKL